MDKEATNLPAPSAPARLATLSYLGAIHPGRDPVLDRLLNSLRQNLQADFCVITLALTDRLYLRAWSGTLPFASSAIRTVPSENTVTAWITLTGESTLVHDLSRDPRFVNSPAHYNGVRSMAGAPLVAENQVIGALCAMNTGRATLTPGCLPLLESSAEAISARLQLLGALDREAELSRRPFWRRSRVQRTPVSLEEDLHQAIVRNELRVFYQPIIDLPTGRLVGTEALVRWQHPRLGLLAPGAFLNVAETSGLIRPIGLWVLEQACQQTALWKKRLPGYADLFVSVNLAPQQLQAPALALEIAAVLGRTGLPAADLMLEVTENLTPSEAETALHTVNAIDSLGVRLVLDDFGTGYSFMGHLRKVPVKGLKIPREFVLGLWRDPQATAVVQSIVMLGHALNLEITAEGVESLEQLQHVTDLGCHQAQGHLFSPPVPPDQIPSLVLQAMC